MSDETAGAGQPEDNAPRLVTVAQYVKDLSFESPHAPLSLTVQDDAPKIEISVDVQAQRLDEHQYEVELHVTAGARRNEDTVFIAEVIYAGVFGLFNMDPETTRAVCLIECPRLLFPFARRIVADATRDGGFPPLMLEPIDFAALYQEQARQQAAAEAGSAGEA